MTDPREIHERDQLLAGIRSLAAYLNAYYQALKEEGMNTEEALSLVSARQTDMMFGFEEVDE